MLMQPESPSDDPVANTNFANSFAVNTDPVGGGITPPPADTSQGDNQANDDNPQASGVSVNAAGQNVGLLIQDETGAVSNLRRNPETGELYDPGDISLPNTVKPTVAGVFNPGTRPRIEPRPNVLDQFSSYTYRISVYLMTPQQYEALIKSTKKSVNGYNLLFQSGGAPINSGGFLQELQTRPVTDETGVAYNSQDLLSSAGRNPAFPLDFYIDSCTLTNLPQGQGTGISHSVASLKFTVIEPVGITLLDRIYEAVQDAAPKSSTGAVNYQNAQYLMVIRWYGFDANGNVVGGSSNNSDPRAAVEKFIPFSISMINWRVSSKATEYEFDCVPTGQLVATGTRRGTVPFDIQLSQSTVGGILAGELNFADRAAPSTAAPGASTTPTTGDFARADRGQTASAPSKANAAGTPKRTVKQGLMAAMNDFTQQLVQDKIYEFADQYEIVFAPGAEAIRDATIVLKGPKPEAKQTPMQQPATSNPQSLNPATQAKDNSVASKYIFAGQSIVQVIDQVIRNSSYITDQALTIYENDQEKTNSDGPKKTQPVNWFRINFEAVPIGSKQDSRRNDYAYKIRYIISAYKIDNYNSKYFPLGTYRGIHKKYDYWFTGKNTAVLDYSETLNFSYHMLVSGSEPVNSFAEIERRKLASTQREIDNFTFGPASDNTRQGTRGKGNEPAANLADSLYGGANLATTKLQIIGDPAWIQQGSLVGGIREDLFNPNSFLPDGSINFDAEQINFEVAWGRPADYDIQTGLANPATVGKPPLSRVYTAAKVTNEFRQGTFTQTIDGLLFNLPKPDGSNKAVTAAMPAKTSEGREQSSAADPANVTAATEQRLGIVLNSQGRTVDPRWPGTASQNTAAAGAANNAARSEPSRSLPVNNQSSDTAPGSNSEQAPKDTLRSAPPPTIPTSGTGESLAVPSTESSAPPGRLRTDANTGRLIDQAGVAQLNTNQTLTWEP